MARIMVVDDSTVMRLNLTRILTAAGHEIVAEAQNGKEACSLYEKLLPDLVTMDISMPVMSGVDATRAIVTKFPEAVIVMISALNQKKMVYDALKNGARHYIIKPIDRDKVISIINEVLGNEVLGDDAPGSPYSEVVGHSNETDRPKEHFSVENIKGTFFIRIDEAINEQEMDQLFMALQGIRFIKPLSIKFDFGDAKVFNPAYLNRLVEYARDVVDLGGDYESLALNPTMRKELDKNEEIILR